MDWSIRPKAASIAVAKPGSRSASPAPSQGSAKSVPEPLTQPTASWLSLSQPNGSLSQPAESRQSPAASASQPDAAASSAAFLLFPGAGEQPQASQAPAVPSLTELAAAKLADQPAAAVEPHQVRLSLVCLCLHLSWRAFVAKGSVRLPKACCLLLSWRTH